MRNFYKSYYSTWMQVIVCIFKSSVIHSFQVNRRKQLWSNKYTLTYFHRHLLFKWSMDKCRQYDIAKSLSSNCRTTTYCQTASVQTLLSNIDIVFFRFWALQADSEAAVQSLKWDAALQSDSSSTLCLLWRFPPRMQLLRHSWWSFSQIKRHHQASLIDQSEWSVQSVPVYAAPSCRGVLFVFHSTSYISERPSTAGRFPLSGRSGDSEVLEPSGD